MDIRSKTDPAPDARDAARRVLDAFYLEGRVLSEAEYAPLREAMQRPHVLLLGCPDADRHADAVAEFFERQDADRITLDQHRDEGLLLMRVAWQPRDGLPSPQSFGRRFGALADRLQASWRVAMRQPPARVAIFVSRELHCLEDLLLWHRRGELPCEIAMIVSNHADARPLAEAFGIAFHLFAIGPHNKAQVEARQLELLAEHGIDLVVLARYMQVLSADFVRAHSHRIINVHHSLLPAFAGARPYRRAFERGVRIIGATSHYVTEVLDEGPIIEQESVRVPHRSSFEKFLELGRELEKKVLRRAVRWHVEHRVLVYAGKTVVFDAADPRLHQAPGAQLSARRH